MKYDEAERRVRSAEAMVREPTSIVVCDVLMLIAVHR